MSSLPFQSSLFGLCPMATKIPLQASSRVLPSRGSRSRTPVTPGLGNSPRISSITALVTNSILGLRRARSSMAAEARKPSRRCTMVTLVARLVRYVASSMAVSPPPTTIRSMPLKNAPSQVAHADSPWLRNLSSEGMSSHLAEAPVATMTVSAKKSPSPVATLNGRAVSSTEVTSVVITRAPLCSA